MKRRGRRELILVLPAVLAVVVMSAVIAPDEVSGEAGSTAAYIHAPSIGSGVGPQAATPY